MSVFRAPMRARELDAGAYAGARFGLERGLVGTGEALEPAPESIDEALELTAVAYGPKAARMLARFAALVQGTLVWTRTGEDTYRLGRIDGPWLYVDDDAAGAVGIHHVRAARWGSRELTRAEAPAAVVATFDRGGRNLQRINDDEAAERTAQLARELGL